MIAMAAVVGLCSALVLAAPLALLFGSGAADAVLEGWSGVRGGGTPGVAAYWDVVAALNTPTDLSRFLPVFHSQGRIDLDVRSVNERRDAFLYSALCRLQLGSPG
jgi:hypothetical protein